MNVNQYINGIMRKIKCGGKKKKEIKKQLLTDINFRLEQGETLADVMSQMGSIKEIADGFNESLPEAEKKNYARTKAIKIAAIIFVVLALIVTAALTLVHLFVPKGIIDIDQSKYFDKAQVEQAVKDTIELLDNKDYDALQANAIEEMKPYLTEDYMESGKAQIAKDWGKRQSIGKIYMGEINQRKYYAVGEVTVTYENVSVVYRLTYDIDMKLAGLYMR